ncbi:MAG TPA: hypothetical protein VFQ83_06065, partial [Candidatus Udaeobacter sp.]|nr:hypothetical protein [Candidatus Udaeobacter sp.]
MSGSGRPEQLLVANLFSKIRPVEMRCLPTHFDSLDCTRRGQFFTKSDECLANGDGYLCLIGRMMNPPARLKQTSLNVTEPAIFEFQNLEITRNALVLHFFEEKTIIPLRDIASYHFDWYLHDPIFARKWWFLVLTLTLKNGAQESGHVTTVKFNYLSDDSEVRKSIETKISDAIDAALSRVT